MNQPKIKKLINHFKTKYPQPKTALNYSSPFELLVAVILSAQTTDKQVNKVTAKLFKEYNTPEDFSRLTSQKLQNKIKTLGLYRNKSKYLLKTAQMITGEHDGKVPQSYNSLVELPGVGRKTALVVLGEVFSKNTFPVDTHVHRVANRLGLAKGVNVRETERGLKKNVPEKNWYQMHHWLIKHGRSRCKAQNPECKKCEIKSLCIFYEM